MLQLLDTLLLQPLIAIYAAVYDLLPAELSTGGRLIVFSVLLNLVLLPVYNQMEKRSRQGRAIKEQIAREVARMKAHFRGRERYFYIRAVYRQHRYRPISELLGSADLFVQVLVFATVYRFLSKLDALSGASFGPIADLSYPDGLIGGANLLPLLMTAINVAAVLLYTNKGSRRTQALILSAIFLALLYDSAAGMVLYWTSNNLWSLARSGIQRLPIPGPLNRMKSSLGGFLLQR
jgi:membrane protein insertase Oxa1/YidC/SpoIIIJ